MPPLVITTCSAAKRARTSIAVDGIAAGDVMQVAAAWKSRLMSVETSGAAGSVYRGRAFRTAALAASLIGADVGIVSAGLGYVRKETEIPGYDLTVRPAGPGSVRQRVQGRFAPERWWAEVQQGPFSRRLSDDLKGRSLVLAAVSADYARMIAEDLLAFSEAAPDALRIFGLSVGQSLPEALGPFVMPYDSRFGGLRQDFAQRALRHFVEHVLPCSDSLERQRAAVGHAMESAGPRPPRSVRRRGDNETLKACIASLAAGSGNRSDLLRRLRASGWACEQRRFAILYDEAVGRR